MKNFNIDRYLDDAEERFSGFNGTDDFDDFELGDYADDWSMADGGGVQTMKSPSPYQVRVTNTTGGTLTAVLFGLNQYLLTPNFGSAAALVVEPAQANVSYLELLQQSGSQPFETSLIRVKTTNAAQVTETLNITVKDANGQFAGYPLITESYFSAYQQQSGILDIPFTLKIDGNTNIQVSILAATTVTFTFFPAEKVNTAKGLAGQSPLQVYGNPQVNLGGMTFPRRATVDRRRRIGSASSQR
jgi:hypothetical protein